MELGLRDRVYIVTGGSRGLGRATAAALVADGARVVLAARDQEALETAVRQLCTTGGSSDGAPAAVAVAADLADPDTPERLVRAALDTYGRLDGALVSVGGPPAGPVGAVSDAQWLQAFESVFLGATRMLRTLGDVLPEGGSVVLVLSTSVKTPIPDLAVSNGLRPGLAMVAKTFADEVGPRGVRVNALLPGRIDTDRVQELDARSADPRAARRAHEAEIPLRRYGRPEEFGRVAAFVLSPAASFLTGTVVPVDGGATRAL